MIATAISAFILLGVYSMFSGVINTKNGLENTNNNLIFKETLERLIAKDIRMMTAGVPLLPPPDSGEIRLLSMVTQNSLRFNKSLPVEALYYVDTTLDNGTLYRRERHLDMGYQMEMPLAKNVSECTVESFDGSEYFDGFAVNRFIFRFSFHINGKLLQFVTGRMVDTINE
jgi:type II secretory pathway component PulJ